MEEINNIIKDHESRLLELEQKFNKHYESTNERFVFLHKELCKLDDKKCTKTYALGILRKRYNVSNSTLERIWLSLYNLDNKFNFTNNKNDKKAFKIYKKITEAYIEPLDAIY